jgi:hypothetical protein
MPLLLQSGSNCNNRYANIKDFPGSTVTEL